MSEKIRAVHPVKDGTAQNFCIFEVLNFYISHFFTTFLPLMM